MHEMNEKAKYFLVDDNVYVEASGLRARLKLAETRALLAPPPSLTASLPLEAASPPALDTEPAVFRFGRMFRHPELPEYRPDEAGLIELGLDMGEETSPGENPNLPAGYVYLGQFIDHDLSFNTKTNQLPSGIGSVDDEQNLRSPSLDLDSLYGLDPAAFKQTELGRKVYEDEATLRVGSTRRDSDVEAAYPLANDLPREGDPQKPEAAAVVDPRNDENLAVAQTHLTFIKFHNAVVQTLRDTLTGEALFERAREQVVRHYQWVILRDYLPRIVEDEVLGDVLANGCAFLKFEEGEQPAVPFEFAMAGFRFGHSLVSNAYEWNRYFQSQPPGFFAASLDDLFMFTGFGQKNMLNRKTLLNSWIIDWTRFFDFTGVAGVTNSPHSNHARRLTPSLVRALTTLPPFLNDEAKLMASLPTRNLLRGRFLGLPAGQCVARRIGVAELTPEQVKRGAGERRRAILERYGLDQLTPLWYYLLKEAEEHHEGTRLGPVGSRIVVETVVELMRRSRVSILPPEKGEPDWEPDLGLKPGQFFMPDLLFFIERTTGSHINPLGN